MRKPLQFLFLILCLLTNFKLSGQNELIVNLKRTAYPTFYSKLKGKSVINLYDLNKTCLLQIKKKINFPKLETIPKDTAYGEITRKSTQINSFINQYYILVFNYNSSAPVVYTSDSYDFSTSSSVTLLPGRVLKMSVKTDMNGVINYFLQKDTTQFTKIPISTFAKDEDECEHIDGRDALRLDNDFVKVGDVEAKRTEFSLAVYDSNGDGVFNQPGVDKIFLGVPGEEYFVVLYDEKNAVNASFQQENMIIEIGKQKFKVLSIDRNGNFVKLVTYEGKEQVSLKQFVTLPDLKVKLSSGDSLNLRSLVNNKKYIYLDIWWESCPPCIRDIPVLDSIAEKYKSKLTFVGLLDQSNLSDLNRIIKKYNIKNCQALSNPEVNKNLTRQGYPYGVLFSEKGELIKADMDRKQLVEFLNKH
jgi:thiol-disulfide isomerase/thioredoxin